MDFKNIIFFGLGLIVGWNFLPQPQIIKNAIEKIINIIKKIIK